MFTVVSTLVFHVERGELSVREAFHMERRSIQFQLRMFHVEHQSQFSDQIGKILIQSRMTDSQIALRSTFLSLAREIRKGIGEFQE
jgi:hypothetical protein